MQSIFSNGKSRRRFVIGIFSSAAMFLAVHAQAVTADFQLLTSIGAQGVTASTNWLVFGTDPAAAGFNPSGTYSYNFADPSGTAGPLGFAMAPALTGTLTLQFQASGGNLWDVSATGLSYAGQAGPLISMNQFLEPSGGIDGTWTSSEAAKWAIQYNLDFYFATNIDGDPSPGDKDVIFTNAAQTGYLLPYSELKAGLMDLPFTPDGVNITDPNFTSYLLTQIQPQLPTNTTYLLVTWMDRIHPDWTDPMLPVTTNSLIGNMTIAYTTSAIPEPSSMLLLALGAGLLGFGLIRRNRTRAKRS